MERVKALTAADIMTPEVITVGADMTVRELSDVFSEHMISGAPVLDEEGRMIGVVSVSDVARKGAQRLGDVRADFYMHGWEDRFDADDLRGLRVEGQDQLVRDIMTPVIFTVSEDATIDEMAETMIGGRVHRLVVTRDDRVVGIVTTLDMLKILRDQHTRVS